MTDPRPIAAKMIRNLKEPPAGTVAGAHVVATVTLVRTGEAVGGDDLIAVTWRGTEQFATYLYDYTPVVNDTVLCAYDGARLVVLGRIIGTPPEV